MANDLTKSKKSGSGLVTGEKSPRVLDHAFQSLPAEEQKKLLAKAAELQLEQEVKDRDAQRNFNASSIEMERDVHTVKELNKAGPDFTMENTYKTASGETRIKVTKNNNMTWIIVAVVVAVIFFLLFAG